MRIARLMVILGLFPVAGAAAQVTRPDYGRVDRDALDVSIISLIANGAAYDGKAVGVVGVFQLEFEGDMLCLDRESLNHGVSANCISLAAIEPRSLGTDIEQLKNLTGQYVLVEGVFRVEEKGHMAANVAGGLSPISRVLLLEERPQPGAAKE